MRVWDLATRQPLLDPIFEALPCAVADRVLVARTDTIELCRLEREPGHMRLVAPAQLGPDSRIALAGPRDCLVVVGGDSGAFLWNATTGTLVATLVDTHARWVCASPTGDRIYAAARADGLLAWSVRETAAGTIVVEGPERLWVDSDVREISVSADGRLIVGTIGNSVAAFDLDANEERWRLPAFGGVIVPRLSPDGRWLFAGTWKGGAARLFDRLTGETVRTFEGKHVLAEFNAADGSLIVGTGEAFVVHETGTWRAMQPLPRGTREGDQAGKITVNADQRLLALGRTRYVIQLVDSRAYEPLATLWMPDAHMIGNIVFSRDGTTMYATTPGREIHVWDLRAIRRNLSDLGLDWDLPPYAPAETVVPIRVDVVNRGPQ